MGGEICLRWQLLETWAGFERESGSTDLAGILAMTEYKNASEKEVPALQEKTPA